MNQQLSPPTGSGRNMLPVLLAMLLIMGGIGLYALHAGIPLSMMPACPFYSLTGLYCPGCGATRAVKSIMDGRFLDALDYNPLLIISIPLIIYLLILEYPPLAGRLRIKDSFTHRPWFPIAAFVVLVVYALLRNLPWYPFTILAP